MVERLAVQLSTASVAACRIERLERAIDDAVKTAPANMRVVIEALQALRGIAQVSAVTIVAEVGEL